MMVRLGFLLALLFSMAACDLTGSDTSDARIQERGVDGVRFGDTRAEARQILGANQGGGIADGSSRSWRVIDYTEGPHAGLTIYFAEDFGEPDSTYPADLFAIYPPFLGKTPEGIGISSTISEVRKAYKAPLDSSGFSTGTHKRLYYCFGRRDLEIVLREDSVTALFLGYNEPHPESRIQCSD